MLDDDVRVDSAAAASRRTDLATDGAIDGGPRLTEVDDDDEVTGQAGEGRMCWVVARDEDERRGFVRACCTIRGCGIGEVLACELLKAGASLSVAAETDAFFLDRRRLRDLAAVAGFRIWRIFCSNSGPLT